ncbi:hypothetical protein ACFPMF_07320 [Larkinella bovis]|uniref:Uncharacterized protein n=1 Tax=Larkinella bovis TaxID=683041 RepID=A0ABW0I6W7_9BACT
MTFAEHFNIQLLGYEDWFDPILEQDTRLFIDPLLAANSRVVHLQDAKEKISHFFKKAFEIAAESQPNIRDIRYRILLRMLVFPEVEEICLGYASFGTKGSGSSNGFSRLIAQAIYDSINMGIDNIDNFELLGIFNEGIGPDRISDTTANILKADLIAYTQDICIRNNVPTKNVLIRNYKYNFDSNRWDSEVASLPINPINNKPIILVPKDSLVYFHTINSDAFLDYIWRMKGEEITDSFSFWLKGEINKSDIIQIARQRRGWVEEFEKYIIEELRFFPYDLQKDPQGVYIPLLESTKYAKDNPIALSAKDEKEFYEVVDFIIEQYSTFMENHGGYKLLWNDNNKPKREEAAQIMFTCVVKQYCRANNIDLTREANIGRGPVDFKFSSGYHDKVIIELKLAKNSKFWSGLEKQLPKYMEAEEAKYGYFIVICYSDDDLKKVADINNVVENVKEKAKIDIKTLIIDATPEKPSASKL